MVDLYDTSKHNISSHIKNIFIEGEVSENFNCQEILDSSKRRKQEC